MFGKKKNKSIEVNKLSSLIADNVEIVGDVIFSGGLRVDGRVEGNVINKGDERGLLVLSQRAFTQLSRGDKQQQNQCPHCAHQHGKEWEQREGQI